MRPVPIVALDVPDANRAQALVHRLGDSCGFYKVGGELFTAAGPAIVQAIRDSGKRVFLDLKFHDIPNTVRASARSAASAGASLITVHAIGGRAMIAAAVEGAGGQCGVLAVTVLTSLDPQAYADATGKPPGSLTDEAIRLAGQALQAGAHGVVCSGHEVAQLRAATGDRLAGDAVHDQSRVVTPGDAARAGATYLVLGRTVTGAPDPVAAMELVRAELLLAT